MAYPFESQEPAGRTVQDIVQENALERSLAEWSLKPHEVGAVVLTPVDASVLTLEEGIDGGRRLAADLLKAGLRRRTPQVDNMGGGFSHTPQMKRILAADSLMDTEDGKIHKLMSPSFYRDRLALSDPSHWVFSDPKLFASLPQGGGGVDALEVSVWGRLNDRGIELREAFLDARGIKSKKLFDAVREADAKHLRLESLDGKGVVIRHPADESVSVYVGDSGGGKGRSRQPLLLREDGFVVKYGKLLDSKGVCSSGVCGAGPVAFIEIHGTEFLRYGEAEALRRVFSQLARLGIEVDRMRASRVDLCADLPGVDIDVFKHAMANRCYTSKAVGAYDQHFDALTGRYSGFTLKSGETLLRVYEKVLQTAGDCDKRRLMEEHRWGGPQDKAVRVEYQLRLRGKTRRSYDTLDGLLGSLGDLIAWCTNVWFRLSVVTDRTHTSRAPIADVWLRVQHAFSWWASRLDKRVTAPPMYTAPAETLVAQMRGLMATVCALSGVVPENDETVFAVCASWLPPGEMVQRVAEKAAKLRTLGVLSEVMESPVSIKMESLYEVEFSP